MRIIDDLISSITDDAPVRDVRQGPFQTAVLSLHCGLASTPHNQGYKHGDSMVTGAGELIGKSALTLAQMSRSESLFEAAIGMATINSVIEVDESKCTELNAIDLLIEKADGKDMALIGHFPFVNKLEKATRNLWVIERQPQPGDHSAEETDDLVPQADVVGITGQAFINHSIDHLLELCSTDAYVVIIGGTTPLSPLLFDYGVSAICGTKVENPDLALLTVSQGAIFKQIQGKKLLTMVK